MRGNLFGQVLFAFFIQIYFFKHILLYSQASVVPEINNEEGKDVKDEFIMPEYLNTNTFYEQVSNSLTVVEFFSPYCSHCKTLAPIWKDAVTTFVESGMDVEYKIDYRQVDCVQSGDICSSEKVPAYPLIRLYGPKIDGLDISASSVSENHLKNYPSDFKRNKEDLIKFGKLESLEYYKSKSESVEKVDENEEIGNHQSSPSSSSKQEIPLNSDELISIISDIDIATGEEMKENEKTWVISFIDEESSHLEKEWWSKDSFFKNNWEYLGKELDAHGVNLGTFNCHDFKNDKLNEDICKELVNWSEEFPQLVVITPKKKINKIFPYDKKDMGGFSNKKIVDFALRVNHNSYIPKINTMTLNSFVSGNSEEPIPTKRDEKIFFVFQYDAETITPEDFDFLEHLILPLSKLPNFYMYHTDQDLEKFNLRLLEKANNNLKKNDLFTDYSENMITNKLLSQVPTFHIYKENSKIPSTYRCFSTVDLRDLNMILEWVYKDFLPSIIEIKDTNAELIFNYNKKDYEQVVLMFVDLLNTDSERVTSFIKDFRKNYEAYELSRWNYQYEVLNNERKYKEDKINKLKNEVTGSDRSVLFKEMKKEVLLNDFEKRALFAIVDTNKYPINEYNFVHEALKDVNALENIESGSVLIVDNGKFSNGKISVFENSIVYDSTHVSKLTLEDFSIANLLSYINFDYTLLKDENSRVPILTFQVIAPTLYIRTIKGSSQNNHKTGLIIRFFLVCSLVAFMIKFKKRINLGKKINWKHILRVPLMPLRFFGISITSNGRFRFSGWKNNNNNNNKSKLTYNNIGILSRSNKPID